MAGRIDNFETKGKKHDPVQSTPSESLLFSLKHGDL